MISYERRTRKTHTMLVKEARLDQRKNEVNESNKVLQNTARK